MEKENRELQKVHEQSLSPLSEEQVASVKLGVQYFASAGVPVTMFLELAGAGPGGWAIGALAGIAAAYFSGEIHDVIEPGLRTIGTFLAFVSSGRRTGVQRTSNRLLNRNWWLGQEVAPYVGPEGEEEDGQGEEEDYDEEDGLVEDDFDDGYLNDEAFLFSQLLASGWRPSYKQIFLARLEDGTDVFVSVPDLVHIALAGSTRQGKTSIIRQLLLQLCYIGCTCILLDPHYTPYDIDIDEDWTPYTRFLRFDPLECKSFERMEKILRQTATTVLDGRKKLRENSKSVGVPIFIIIDEYPAVVAERPKVQDHVAKLLREGAKYKIFLCIASQDFHVKTVSPQAGGAIRDNYKTVLYVGGDATTAKVLLDAPVSPDVESLLGKGPVMLRCAAIKKASFAHTPFTDNAAIYRLLGPSSYEPGEGTVVVSSEEMGGMDKEEFREELVEEVAVVAPIIANKGPKAAEININVLCACWNGGATTVEKLQTLFGMSHGEAYKAYKRIKAQRQEAVEEQE